MYVEKEKQTGRKLAIVLLSLGADQYSVGVARYSSKSVGSLEALQGRFATGTVWRFPNVTLFTSENHSTYTLRAASPSACARQALRDCCRASASPWRPNPPQPSRRYFS